MTLVDKAALTAALAERNAALENARTARVVHAEHVERMNVLLLHEQAVADAALAERDAARAESARLRAAAEEVLRHATYSSDTRTAIILTGPLRAALAATEDQP